jgi:RNA polymerase sigma-70 factor (ECF subfamily)
MIPTAANGQPALAAYIRGCDGIYRAHSICVLTTAASRVTRVTSFNDPGLFATFGLPQATPLPRRWYLAVDPGRPDSMAGRRCPAA